MLHSETLDMITVFLLFSFWKIPETEAEIHHHSFHICLLLRLQAQRVRRPSRVYLSQHAVFTFVA